MPYAIQNKRTKKFVFATDWRFSPPHQITEFEAGMVFTEKFDAEITMMAMKCGKEYEVVEIKPLEVVD